MSAALALMPQTASVYTEHPTTGDFTVLATSGLVCQLAHISGGGASGLDRAELANRRLLYWDPAYTLPTNNCQVEVRGERWNVDADTVTDQRDENDTLAYRKADVVRVN